MTDCVDERKTVGSCPAHAMAIAATSSTFGDSLMNTGMLPAFFLTILVTFGCQFGIVGKRTTQFVSTFGQLIFTSRKSGESAAIFCHFTELIDGIGNDTRNKRHLLSARYNANFRPPSPDPHPKTDGVQCPHLCGNNRRIGMAFVFARPNGFGVIPPAPLVWTYLQLLALIPMMPGCEDR